MKLLLSIAISFAAFAAITFAKSALQQKVSNTGSPLALIKCQQSSVYKESGCIKAIENDSPMLSNVGLKCSHLLKEPGWWSAKTVKRAHIRRIRITNREDGVQERLNDFSISVDGVECVRHLSSVAFFQKVFECNAIGQEIKISSNKEYLTLCKVEVYGEYVAKLELSNCKQSSNYLDKSICSGAIDGTTNVPGWSVTKMSTTKADLRPWWEASTAAPSKIKQVRIFNRQDCCQERLNNFVIKVDDIVCAEYNSKASFAVRTFDCNKVGRTVRIESLKSTYLTLVEVEVFGEKMIVANTNDRCTEVHIDSQTFCILQQRLDGSVQFNRTWAEYENGFGDSRNFWTGLRWLHEVTAKSSNLMFRAELRNWAGHLFVAKYSGFVVKDASQRYAMDYNSFLANASTVTIDALLLCKGKVFSTMDQESEDSECSTAYSGGAGWWFGSCSTSNPNGPMVARGSSKSIFESAHWYAVSNAVEPLKSIRLLIQKPVQSASMGS